MIHEGIGEHSQHMLLSVMVLYPEGNEQKGNRDLDSYVGLNAKLFDLRRTLQNFCRHERVCKGTLNKLSVDKNVHIQLGAEK